MHKLLVSFTPSVGQEHYVDAPAGRRQPRRGAAAGDGERDAGRPAERPRGDGAALPVQPAHLLRRSPRALFVSLNTLKSHVRTVYRKLGVASRADAVEAGRRSASSDGVGIVAETADRWPPQPLPDPVPDQARILAFCCANSASVSTPWALQVGELGQLIGGATARRGDVLHVGLELVLSGLGLLVDPARLIDLPRAIR